MRGVYLAAFFLLAIDVLVVWRAVQRLVWHEGTISPDAPLFLLLLLALQILLVILFFRLREVSRYYRRLQETAEHQLELSNQLMDGLDIAVSVLDENGCFVFVNRACAELLGVPGTRLLGQPILNYVVEQAEQSVSGEQLTAPAPGHQQGFQLTPRQQWFRATVRCADGREVKVLSKVTPRWHAGRMVGRIATVVPAPSDLLQEATLPEDGREEASRLRG